MLMIILALLAGLSLSATAAYYSIIGLVTIFPGAKVPIIIMGIVLEFGKLVAASWIYRNWRISPILIKIYMVLAVLVLIFITSMGIFGFLSKAHLQHTTIDSLDNTYQVETLNSTIESREKRVILIEKQIANIDDSLTRYIELGAVSKGLVQKKNLNAERLELETQRESTEAELIDLKTKRNVLMIEVKKVEAEVGPLRYIAELVYGEENAPKMFDKTVRWIIVLLVAVFDPFAIALLLAANVSLLQRIPRIKEGKKVDQNAEMMYTTKSEPEQVVVMDDVCPTCSIETTDGHHYQR